MRKIIYLLLFFQYISFGQIENSIFPQVPYSALHTIAVSGDYIYAGGDCNTGLFSTDGGTTWNTVALNDGVRNVRILPGSNGSKAIFQYTNEIFVFDSSTENFEEISSTSLFLSSGNFVSIEVDDENVYVISNQNIHKAAAGQYDWDKIADFDFDNDAVVVSDITENYLHIGTLNGMLMRVNTQSNATETMNDFMNRIFSFDMVSDDLGYLSIQNFTYPIKTTDGGATYSELENLPENIGVRGYGEDVIMTINTNRIYVSTDGGASSTFIRIPEDGTFDLIQASYVTDDGNLYLVGRSSTVAKTEDFGQTFINLNDYKRENLQDIEIHPSGTGVAVGGYSSVIKTTDGGETWSLVDWAYDQSNYLQAVAVMSENRYVIGGNSSITVLENDQIVSTVERGIDYMHKDVNGEYLIAIQSSNSDRSVIKSSDGGLTWETKVFLPGFAYSISQSPSGKLFIPGQDGLILTSTDKGETWDIESFGDDLDVRDIVFYDDNLGLASTGLRLYKTTDGGATAEMLVQSYLIKNMYFITEDQLFYTSATNAQTNIYESTDGGESFSLSKEYCSESQSSYKDENDAVWFAQKGGHINRFFPKDVSSTSELDFGSMAFYPNPVIAGQDLVLESEIKINQVTITSITGEIIDRIIPESNTIPTEGLNKGLFVITATDVNGKINVGKLIVVE